MPPLPPWEVMGRLRVEDEVGRVGVPLAKGNAGGGGYGEADEREEVDVVGRMICSLCRNLVLLLEAPPPAAEPDEGERLSVESMYLGL
jgi:hypothetical protein